MNNRRYHNVFNMYLLVLLGKQSAGVSSPFAYGRGDICASPRNTAAPYDMTGYTFSTAH